MKNKKYLRVTAGMLATVFLVSQGTYAAPPTVQTDEAVYVNLDYYGTLKDMRIVKGVSLNGETSFTDHGVYTEVHNMTSYDKPILTENTVTWQLEAPQKTRFYYECIPTHADAMQMPWTFDVSYQLDGVPVKAEACAGASGLIEITVHAIPNSEADAYYRNNMTLMVITGIDMDKARSLDAPGAQIQSFGTYKLAVFLGLPGEDNTYTIRIGASEFESMGMMMLMAPATMSQLDRISDFRDMRDKVGDARTDLYAGLSDLLDAIGGMQGGLSAMSAGIAGLDAVRQQLNDSRSLLDPDIDEALTSLQALIDEMDSSVPELMQSQENLTRLQGNVNDTIEIITGTRDDIDAYRKATENLTKSLHNVTTMLDDIADKTYGDGDIDWVMENLQFSLDALRTASDDLSSALNGLRSNLDLLISGIAHLSPELAGYLFDSDIAEIMDGTQEMIEAVGTISSAGNSLLALVDSYLDVIEKHAGDLATVTESLSKLTAQADSTLKMLGDLSDELPEFQSTLDDSVPVFNSLLQKIADLLTTTKQTLVTTNQTLTDLRQTLLSIRAQADDSASQSIDGLLEMMQKALDSSGTTGTLQTATDSIHQAIQNEIDGLEDDTNVLDMDNSLALRSFTSSDNPAPASLQFILRTDEISIDNPETPSLDEPKAEDEGVLARIANVFKKLGKAIASVFSSDD